MAINLIFDLLVQEDQYNINDECLILFNSDHRLDYMVKQINELAI